MGKSFQEALAHRRSYYAISDHSSVSDAEIEAMVQFAVKHVPSAFNSQSTRVVLFLGEPHKKLWSIAMEALRRIVPENSFAPTEAKINSFAAGYGTVLFWEDQSAVKSLQAAYPLYADNFPTWSEHTSAMHQLAIWTMLEDAGLGASLQHYTPLIEAEVRSTWDIPQAWKLIAQMPFGTPTAEPGEKTFQPIDERMLIFK